MSEEIQQKLEEKIEDCYQNQAKEIVDLMFETKCFNDKFTRDNMRSLEDLIAFYFQTNARSAYKSAEVILKFKKIL